MRKVEERAVSNFERVLLKDFGDVYITQGESESLQIEADEEMLPRIKTEVVDRRLIISIEGDWLRRISLGFGHLSGDSIRLNLQVRQLTSAEVIGAGRLRAARLETPSLDVKLAGAGSIEIGGLACGTLTANLPGAGKIELEGAVVSQDVQLSGAGSFQGLKLESKRAKVHVSGVGNAAVNVADELDVHISGLGGVQYKGEPRLQTNISGLGRLTKS